MLPVPMFDDRNPDSRCSFKKINERFTKGISKDIEIIFMNSNAYVNCTQICNKLCTNPSDWKTVPMWLADGNNKNIIEDAVQKTDLLKDDLIINVDAQNYKGTYLHPFLVDHIIVWFGGPNVPYYTKMIREFMLFKKDDEIMELFVTKHPPRDNISDEDLMLENNSLRTELLLFSTHKLGFTLDDLAADNNKLRTEILHLREELVDTNLTIARLQRVKSSRGRGGASIKAAPIVKVIKNERRSISPPRTAIVRENDRTIRSKSVHISRPKFLA